MNVQGREVCGPSFIREKLITSLKLKVNKIFNEYIVSNINEINVMNTKCKNNLKGK